MFVHTIQTHPIVYTKGAVNTVITNGTRRVLTKVTGIVRQGSRVYCLTVAAVHRFRLLVQIVHRFQTPRSVKARVLTISTGDEFNFASHSCISIGTLAVMVLYMFHGERPKADTALGNATKSRQEIVRGCPLFAHSLVFTMEQSQT
jgi:hypothetical protein